MSECELQKLVLDFYNVTGRIPTKSELGKYYYQIRKIAGSYSKFILDLNLVPRRVSIELYDLRFCKKCKTFKPVDEFSTAKNWCKKCHINHISKNQKRKTADENKVAWGLCGKKYYKSDSGKLNILRKRLAKAKGETTKAKIIIKIKELKLQIDTNKNK